MKTKHLFLLILSAGTGGVPAFAQWAVIDVASIQQNAMNYAVLVDQLAHQATQISNQVRQIQQFETELKRMGDMANIKKILGFEELKLDLSLPSKIKTWAEDVSHVDGRGLFGDTRGGVFRQVEQRFSDFDGKTVERDGETYKKAHGIAVTVDEFKVVQTDVYSRREDLKQAIARTSEAMQAADTEAEHRKLESVLTAQYSQLAAVDAEVALSAAQVQVKEAEANAMSDALEESEAETRRHLSRQETKKIATAFFPEYECMLQYVEERRISP